MEQNPLYSFIKYDSSSDYNFNMYDNMPYIRDVTLCNASTVRLESGNLIKYYSCISKGSRSIVNKETLTDENNSDTKDYNTTSEGSAEVLWDNNDKRQNAVGKLVEMALLNN